MIRPFVESDLGAVYAIQVECRQSAQWRERDYVVLAGDPGGLVLVAEAGGTRQPHITGFAAFYRVGAEAELRNLAVEPSHQRQGHGRALLTEGIRLLHAMGVRCVFLEVRASNQAANALYQLTGFQVLYTRHNYYYDPMDDALVMSRDLEITKGEEPS